MSRLAFVVLALVAIPAFAEPRWRHFFHQADLIWGLSFPERDYGYCTQFRSGSGPEAGSGLMLTKDGQSFEKLYDAPGIFMHQAVAMESRTAGVAGGINLVLPARIYTKDGLNFSYSSGGGGGIAEIVSDAYPIPGKAGGFVAIGTFGGSQIDGVSVSSDGGESWSPPIDWGWAGQGSPQDAAVVDSNTWFVAGGRWPRRDDDDLSSESRTIHVNELASFDLGGENAGLHLDHSDPADFQERSAKGKQTGNDYVAVIQRTTDGGKTFENVFSDTGNFYIEGISCVNAKVCYAAATAAASGGWLYKTVDGGDTWTEHDFWPGMPIGPVQFFDEKTGWVGGGSPSAGEGYALFTSDGGATWRRHKLLDMLLKFDLNSPEDGWATGITIFMQAGDLLQLRDLEA